MGTERRMGDAVGWVALAAAALITIGCGTQAGTEGAGATEPTAANSAPDLASEDSSSTSEDVGNVIEVLEADGRFTTYLNLISDRRIMERSTFDNTIFVPTDEAFAALPADALERLRDDEQLRREFVRRNLTAGQQHPEEMGEWLRSGVAVTAAGGSIEFSLERKGYDSRLIWGGAPVVETNIRASNGLIHVLGEVVLPETDAGSS